MQKAWLLLDIAILGYSVSMAVNGVSRLGSSVIIEIVYLPGVFLYPVTLGSLSVLIGFLGFLLIKRKWMEAPFCISLVAVGYDAPATITNIMSGARYPISDELWLVWGLMTIIPLLVLRKRIASLLPLCIAVLLVFILSVLSLFMPSPMGDYLEYMLEGVVCAGAYLSLSKRK